jgi:hypothetical protein
MAGVCRCEVSGNAENWRCGWGRVDEEEINGCIGVDESSKPVSLCI